MMDERSWAQQSVDRFFEYRQSPTQLDCDDYARRVTGASTVQEVAIPGSLSYTVLCTDSRVFDDVRQHEIRTMAMQATKIGAVLRYAFQRNTDGSPSEELTTSNWALKTLKTLLCC
ncbi:hypothetical protein ASPTUDRAFT_40718 [Aspergillus tubingensis CBS 134.48]|uniref:Uncharacterized protein n=1 Tax=Aspergillus tubingensis (strain CBS 134.48) TaxID=767770 RepID=A0A1L9N6E9_ASPTC|nr:hypothetical protein ASPTUDRAFT_40718 [Aspergillus tubingensis CBS 134.48]